MWPFNSKSNEERRLEQLNKELREVEIRNKASIAATHLENIKSKGVAFEQDPIFGWPYDFAWDMGSNVPVSAFPREIYPERPTTLRTQIAQDAIRFQSRVWYETCPQYSGVINHLRNFIIGAGLTIQAVSEDEELAESVQEYLDEFCNYKENRLHKRLYDTVLNYYRDGEDAIRLFPDKENVNIRSVDTSTIRGPHNEITGPWAYGVLTSWPYDYDDIKAFHIWYADNSHEDVSPKLLKFLKSETTGANVKRGVPLAYRMRKQIEQLIKLSDSAAIGEAARQSIPYIIQYQLAQAGTVTGQINSRIPQPNNPNTYANYNSLGDPKQEIVPGEIRHIGPGKEFQMPPGGNDGTWAYQMLCQQMATAINCPAWMVSGTSADTNFSSSLVAESPLIKLIQHAQQQVTDYYKCICESALEIAIAKGQFPVNTLEIIDIHCELPSPVARNRKEEIEIDIQLLKENILSPQHLAARNNLEFEEEQDLIKKAKEMGWVGAVEPDMIDGTNGKNGENPQNEMKKLEE